MIRQEATEEVNVEKIIRVGEALRKDTKSSAHFLEVFILGKT